MKLIKREKYLNELIGVIGTPDIKVITGIRRSGKSKLLEAFKKYIEENIKDYNIIHINYSLSKFDKLKECHKLYEYIDSNYKENMNNFVLIDEVQMCDGFETAINWIHAEEKYDIYITGSNAFLLSSDLATLFTGRTFPIEVYPFSFSEFMKYYGYDDADKVFDEYVIQGGMAGSYVYTEQADKYKYIEDVYKNAFAHGVIDIVTSPIDTYSFSSRLNNIIDLYKHKNALEEKTMRQTRKIQRLNEKIIESLGNVESGAHIKRVKFFTKILAECAKEECPEYGLTQNDIDMIVQASPLHDVGKISISDTILLKPGKLTPEEFEIMKTHTTKGYDIILRIFNDEGEEEYMQYCSQIARYHHEKFDGGGYPEGLTGDEIPIGAQLVSLADVYDALIIR